MIVSIILLLPSSRVSTRLLRIPFGEHIDNYKDGFWSGWGSIEEDEDEGGVRLVVFGDSWVGDNGGEEGKMPWVDAMCDEVFLFPPKNSKGRR